MSWYVQFSNLEKEDPPSPVPQSYMGFDFYEETITALLDLTRSQLLELLVEAMASPDGFAEHIGTFMPSVGELCMVLQVQYSWYVSIHGVGP